MPRASSQGTTTTVDVGADEQQARRDKTDGRARALVVRSVFARYIAAENGVLPSGLYDLQHGRLFIVGAATV